MSATGHLREDVTVQRPLFLGIDGGGSSCRARLGSVSDDVLGEGLAGPANVRLGLETAFASVLEATQQAFEAAGLDETAFARTSAGMGLAGVHLRAAFEEASRYPLPFGASVITTDTEIARLGAHRGGDGGIVIAGTGSIAEGSAGGRTVRLGGWGFDLGDQGSGASIGRAAVRHSLLAHDRQVEPGTLSRTVLATFENDPDKAVHWAETARPADYAAFAQTVLRHAEANDPAAVEIIASAARAVDRLVLGLARAGIGPIVLLGGLSGSLRPWLGEEASAFLVEPRGSALDGALLLARRVGDRSHRHHAFPS